MKRIIIASIIVLLNWNLAISQTVKQETLEEVQKTLSDLHNDAFVRTRELGEIDLESFSKKETITLELFSDITIVVQKESVTEQAQGGSLWYGRLVGGGKGYVNLFLRNGTLSGSIYTSSSVYKLNSQANGGLRVTEVDPNGLPDENNELLEIETVLVQRKVNQKSLRASAATPCVIDVMVVYSQELEDFLGGAQAAENEVLFRVAEANQVFVNSEIFVEFRLAHHQVVTSVPNDASSSSDVKTDEVYDLRDLHKADIVSFWNTDGSTGSGGNYNGRSSSAFNTCNYSAVESQYTFVHECGHNMGAKHDRQNYYDDDPTNSSMNLSPYYQYGKSFVGYRSIMSYNNCDALDGGSSRDCERVPYFTNPEISVNGQSFGVVGNTQSYDPNGPANNALRLNETAPTVKNYYDNPISEDYDLTVGNGSGSGTYSLGTSVNIVANEPSTGMVFDQWTGDVTSISDVNSATTSITVNQDLTITATYKNSCNVTSSLIEAECFYEMSGIQTEESSEGTDNIGFIENDDWALYRGIDLTDVYSVNFRVASKNSGGTIEIHLDGLEGDLLGEVIVSNTTDWQVYETASANIGVVDGMHDIYLVFKGETGSLFNINWFGFSEEVVCNNIVSKIEAECYDNMSGIQTEGCSEGTLNVGWINNGDWMMYENIDLSDMKSIRSRVANNNLDGSIEVHVDAVDGDLIGELIVSNTGGNQNWVTDSININTIAGTHDVYLVFTGGEDYLFNVNWFGFSDEEIVITSINNIILSNIEVYPNPTSDNLTIKSAQGAKYELYDSNGLPQLTGVISSDVHQLKVDELAKGIYVLKIFNDQVSEVKQIIMK